MANCLEKTQRKAFAKGYKEGLRDGDISWQDENLLLEKDKENS